MVEKSNAGRDLITACTFDAQRSDNLSFLCIALECGFSHSPSNSPVHEGFQFIDVFDNCECTEAPEYFGNFGVPGVMRRRNSDERNTSCLRTAGIIDGVAQIPQTLVRMCTHNQVQAIWRRLWIRN